MASLEDPRRVTVCAIHGRADSLTLRYASVSGGGLFGRSTAAVLVAALAVAGRALWRRGVLGPWLARLAVCLGRRDGIGLVALAVAARSGPADRPGGGRAALGRLGSIAAPAPLPKRERRDPDGEVRAGQPPVPWLSPRVGQVVGRRL